MTAPHAIVTAGGTQEAVDDVRILGNSSTGALGTALASALADRGLRVTLFAGVSAVTRGVTDGRLTVVPFKSAQDLHDKLHQSIAADPPALLAMAAAVSDYTAPAVAGKIRSDAAELVLRLERAPKILGGLRAACGPSCVLVGFKLLSGVPVDELVAVARRQIDDNGLDACFANDARRFGAERHPGHLVTPAGVVDLDGDKEAVARGLAAALWRAEGPGHHPLAGLPPALVLAAPLPGAHWGQDVLQNAIVGRPWRPVVAQQGLVGAAIDLGVGWAPFVAEPHRGRGLGGRIFDLLDEQGLPLASPEALLPWVIARGARVEGQVDGIARLKGPRQRNDLVGAASVALFDVVRRRLLVGQRKAGGNVGAWALPGGKLDPGEHPLHAALRELHEETGLGLSGSDVLRGPLSVPPALPLMERIRVYAGTGNGARAYAIDAWVVPVVDCHEPVESEELAGRWIPLHEVVAMPHVTHGTREVARRLAVAWGVPIHHRVL